VFCIYLRTNSDLCHLQHKLIGFYNRDEKRLQRGTHCVFKESSLRFVFKGLNYSIRCLFLDLCQRIYLYSRTANSMGVLAGFFKVTASSSNWRRSKYPSGVKVKIKVTLVQALRLYTGRTAQRGSRGIALLFHDQRLKKGVRGQRHAPAALYRRERHGIHCTGGWVGPRAGPDKCGKSRPHRDSIPGPSSP